MGTINKEWHEKHKMPKNASDDERIAWHIQHNQNCSCRPIPKKVLELMRERGIEKPRD
jgi:hypothetical protein